jgi:hypothetical protein
VTACRLQTLCQLPPCSARRTKSIPSSRPNLRNLRPHCQPRRQARAAAEASRRREAPRVPLHPRRTLLQAGNRAGAIGMRSSLAYDRVSRSTSARESCGTYVPAHHGTGAIGRMRGIIEFFLRLPLLSLPSEYRPSDIFVRRSPQPAFSPVEHRIVLSVLPGIAFSLHLTVVTGQYGVSEVLLSSFIASFVFSVFGAQPLCIAGVTGLSLARPCVRFPEPHLKLEALFPS